MLGFGSAGQRFLVNTDDILRANPTPDLQPSLTERAKARPGIPKTMLKFSRPPFGHAFLTLPRREEELGLGPVK